MKKNHHTFIHPLADAVHSCVGNGKLFSCGTSFNNATSISVNSFYTDNISDKYEKDFYKFTLTSPGSVYINFQHENLFDSAEYWYAVLYDVNTNEITTYGFSGTATIFNTKKAGSQAPVYREQRCTYAPLLTACGRLAPRLPTATQ